MASYTVILDACVMYPAPLRSYLMYLANTGLFRARWTEQIHDEWTRNLPVSSCSTTRKGVGVTTALNRTCQTTLDTFMLMGIKRMKRQRRSGWVAGHMQDASSQRQSRANQKASKVKGVKSSGQSVGSKSSIVLNKHSKIRRGKSDMLPANQRLSLCSMSSRRGQINQSLRCPPKVNWERRLDTVSINGRSQYELSMMAG